MDKVHNFVYGVLVGVIMVLGVLLVTRSPQSAFAQTASDAGGMAVATGFGPSGQSSTSYLWVMDAASKRLAVYQCDQGKAVKALGVRNITWDLMIPTEAEAPQLADFNAVKKGAMDYEEKEKKRAEEEAKKEGKKDKGS